MGMRPLIDEALILQSLQKGPVPPVGANPCTHIPNRGTGRCTLTQKNFAGGDDHDRVAHAPPVFPDFIVRFGVASASVS
ncbi:hypothetical protein Dsin_024115 [Dipteronia sinensis]|uniref:Uncharacterized protein n=1 Tax=Dipteronia sinensis TaxID=43782 RepID=A0AAE0A4M8_9ROSI|nr:hypothetical protein Dsin_024115 [Dipteronia sinensis]